MKLVVDTNIIISALLQNSTCREVLLKHDHHFLTPKAALLELKKHQAVLSTKTGLQEKEIEQLLSIVSERILVNNDYQPELPRARAIMEKIDLDDAHFLARAFAQKCDGIRSEDKHFKMQTSFAVYTTRELLATQQGQVFKPTSATKTSKDL